MWTSHPVDQAAFSHRSVEAPVVLSHLVQLLRQSEHNNMIIIRAPHPFPGQTIVRWRCVSSLVEALTGGRRTCDLVRRLIHRSPHTSTDVEVFQIL